MIIPTPIGSNPVFEGHTLYICCTSIGIGSIMAGDLLVLNCPCKKVGYFNSTACPIGVGIGFQNIDPKGHQDLTFMNEVFSNESMKMTIFVLRGSVSKGKICQLKEDLKAWIIQSKFSRVIVVTTTTENVRQIRESNSLPPDFFMFWNKTGSKFSDKMQEGNKLNKLGYFDKDITEENEELNHLSGIAISIMRGFTDFDIPCFVLAIYSNGGNDFIGALFIYYKIIELQGGSWVNELVTKMTQLEIKDGFVPPEFAAPLLLASLKVPHLWKFMFLEAGFI